jgi:hypothetical protein
MKTSQPPPRAPPVNHKPSELSNKVLDSVRKLSIPTLRYGKNSPDNFAKFEKDLSVVCGMEFGTVFTAIKNGAYPLFEDPVLTDVEEQEGLARADQAAMPEQTPEQVADKAARLVLIDDYYGNLSPSKVIRLNAMFYEKYKSEVKFIESERKKLIDLKPRLFWTILGNLSPESTDRVKSHLLDKWTALEKSQDPLVLYQAIKATHTAFGTGADPTDAAKTRSRYHTLKMGEREGLSSFKERHDTMVRAMEALGLTPPSEAEQTADLLTKVNSTFAPAAAKIEDAYKIAGTFPKTNFEAFRLLTELTADKQVYSSSSATFMATKESDQQVKPEKKQGAPKPELNRSSGGNNRTIDNSNRNSEGSESRSRSRPTNRRQGREVSLTGKP